MSNVPSKRLNVDPSKVLAGSTVAGGFWQDVAALNNWILGRGRVLVPSHAPNFTIAASTAYTLNYYLNPSYQALEREWSFQLKGSTDGGSVDVSINGATSVTVRFGPLLTTATVRETLSSQTDSDGAATVELSAATTSVSLRTVQCREVPRATLGTGTSERGVRLSEPRAGQPIIWGGGRGDSLKNAFAAHRGTYPSGEDALEAHKRDLAGWSVPSATSVTTTAFAQSITSTSYVDLLDLGIPVLGRTVYDGTTDAETLVRVYAWVSGGTGTISAKTSRSGVAYGDDDVSITATSPAWSSPVNVTDVFTGGIDAEDLSTSNGLRSGTFDRINIGCKVSSGQTLYVSAFAVTDVAPI